ncbi:protein YIPF3-like [Homarus americanus]|uniref:protein YIPF3-like n=1 Tax=Homarus americanus TaxID=6706 RepID=UPI001C44D430|nr:protein YIPF3-like [Homarus americanus]
MSHKGHSVLTIESIESSQEVQQRRGSVTNYCYSVWFNLRPYFSVANNKLPYRVFSSMVPPLFFPEFRRVYSDMKGPTCVVMTLALILLYGLHSPHRTLAGELLVTAKLTVGYWFCISFVAFMLGYFCQTSLTPSQLVSITGYSLTGHCLVLLTAEVLHQEDSHSAFFFLTTVFGGLATGRMNMIVLARTPGPAQRLLMCSTLASIHLMHLIYIHFACMRNKFDI